MSLVDRLAHINMDTEWIAVNESGNPEAITKDGRPLRVCKSILGRLTCHDFYAHIRTERVLNAIVRYASTVSRAKNVDTLLALIDNLYKISTPQEDFGKSCKSPKHYAAVRTILESHPERLAKQEHATDNEGGEIFSLPMKGTVSQARLADWQSVRDF